MLTMLSSVHGALVIDQENISAHLGDGWKGKLER